MSSINSMGSTNSMSSTVTHYSDDDLVLFFYREVEDPRQIAAHLASCDECRERYQRLQDDLAHVDELPIPDRGPAYASEMWLRLRPELARAAAPKVHRPWQWQRMAAVAALVIMAFLLGRLWPGKPPGGMVADSGRRIFLAAVSEHLERSQQLLTEISNSSPDAADYDLGTGVAQASLLLDNNRLYRSSAPHHSNQHVVQLLEDLERILLEISHSEPEASESELAYLQRLIESQRLLLKTRLIRSRLEQEITPERRRQSADSKST